MSLQFKNKTKPKSSLPVKAGSLISREINLLLLILWLVSTAPLLLAQTVNISRRRLTLLPLSVLRFPKPQKRSLIFSSFPETWKKKLKEDGSSIPPMMLLNGIKKLVKPLALISPNATCMQFLPNKTFTKSADNQWRKSLTKLKVKAKTSSSLKWPNKNLPFQSITLFNLLSESQNQHTTALRIYSSSCRSFSTRQREPLALIFTSEFWSSFTPKPITTVRAENLSWIGEERSIKITKRKCFKKDLSR